LPKPEPRQPVLPFWVPQSPLSEVRTTGTGTLLVALELARTELETELARTALETELARTALETELARTELETELARTELETELETERETELEAGAELVTVQLPKPAWHPVPQWFTVLPQ